MRKKDLVDYVAEYCDTTKKRAAEIVDTVFEGILEGVRVDGEANFTGFCKFEAKWKEPGTYRNPATGEPVEVNGKYTLKMKAGNQLKEAALEHEDVLNEEVEDMEDDVEVE